MEKLIEDLEKDMKSTSIVMATILHFPIVNADSAKRIIDRAKEEDDYDKIKMIWDAVKEYKNGKS